jgi:hypothetical protein
MVPQIGTPNKTEGAQAFPNQLQAGRKQITPDNTISSVYNSFLLLFRDDSHGFIIHANLCETAMDATH